VEQLYLRRSDVQSMRWMCLENVSRNGEADSALWKKKHLHQTSTTEVCQESG
jgi:hypothetical protein